MAKRGRKPLPKAQKRGELMPHFRVREDELKRWVRAWESEARKVEARQELERLKWVRRGVDITEGGARMRARAEGYPVPDLRPFSFSDWIRAACEARASRHRD